MPVASHRTNGRTTGEEVDDGHEARFRPEERIRWFPAGAELIDLKSSRCAKQPEMHE